MPGTAPSSSVLQRKFVPVGLLVALLGLAYGPVLLDLLRIWESNPQYSHGYLVPLFALGLLWIRRDSLRVGLLRPNSWGLAWIAGALLLRHVGAYLHIGLIEQFSLIACIPGIALAVGGAEALRWSWPSLAFLLFMLPLPYRLEVALQWPLQRLATLASTYAMQTLALPAFATGNLIDVNGDPINVAEACSGLSMLTVFFALSTAVAMVSHRSLLERLIIVASAVPIALVANVFRITLIGTFHFLGYSDAVTAALHDWAALYMMPLALGLLWVEIAFLSRVIIEVQVDSLGPPLVAMAGIPGYRPPADKTKVSSLDA